MNEQVTIKFDTNLIKRLNVAMADASVAVAEAACAAVAQDKRVTVRAFSDALRSVAPMLGTSTQVLAAAVKAAKVDNTTLDDVTTAMAAAADKKRKDDARRAADKRDAAPGKALEKAQAKVEECVLAMRTPLQIARDNIVAADAAVKQAADALRQARAARRAARVALEQLTNTKTDTEQDTEQAA